MKIFIAMHGNEPVRAFYRETPAETFVEEKKEKDPDWAPHLTESKIWKYIEVPLVE